MKVLDLQCSQQHSFEGWFGSEDDFQSQLTRGLVQCPLCGNAEITKKLSAPRFNLGRAVAPITAHELVTASSTNAKDSNNIAVATTAGGVVGKPNSTSSSTALAAKSPDKVPNLSAEAAAALQSAWLEVAKHVMANTEDVGSSFASEARKIHYGEADERAIRGQATPGQTMELIEEGIDIMPLLIPESLKRPLN